MVSGEYTVCRWDYENDLRHKHTVEKLEGRRYSAKFWVEITQLLSRNGVAFDTIITPFSY